MKSARVKRYPVLDWSSKETRGRKSALAAPRKLVITTMVMEKEVRYTRKMLQRKIKDQDKQVSL